LNEDKGGESKMVTVLVIGRHNAESCAFFNEASQKAMAAWASKTAELEAKHGVKMVGSWGVSPEHLSISVYEAPTYEAMQAYSMEPEVMGMMSWTTQEFKVATPFEEAMQAMR
jgi:hypothetical protein